MEALFYLCAFGAVCVLMPAALRLSRVIGAVDVPDGGRKQHAAPTSRLGGLAMFAVFFVGSLIDPTLSDARVTALLSGGTVLFAAGLADDVHPLPAPLKLLLQGGAAVCALLCVELPSALALFGRTVSLAPPLSFALCLLLTVTLINAINFIDGLDGEAVGVLSVGLITLALRFGSADGGGRVLCLLLVACLFAFLLYNRYPAVVFMGDEGSQFLGLSAAILLLSPSGGTFALSSLWLFAVPLFDLVQCVIRRLWHGKNPLRADRSHIHHRLLRRGFSPSAAAGIVTLFAVCGALIGYGISA